MTGQALAPAEPVKPITTTALARVGRKPGPRKAADVPKIPRMSPLIREACAMYVRDDITITAIANRLECTREHLSKALNKPHVIDYLARERKRYVLGDATCNRAARRFVGLLDSDSPKIVREVSDRILTADGTLPNNKGAGITINNTNAMQVGYVVDWSEPVSQ
jgi:hypothetical protein